MSASIPINTNNPYLWCNTFTKKAPKVPDVTLLTEESPKAKFTKELTLKERIFDLDIRKPDTLSIREGEDLTKLNALQFEFQRRLDWVEWQHECCSCLEYAASLKIQHLPQLIPHYGKMAIVGAAPSVEGYLTEIAKFKEDDFDNLMSINGAHAWLIKNGIIPRIHVISEMDVDDVELALGGPPHQAVTYYVSSCCLPKVFEQLEGYNRVLWHHFMPFEGYQELIQKLFPEEFMVRGGFATFFKSMTIAIILGFRYFDLFGLDSSFDTSSHLPGYAMADKEKHITIWGANGEGKRLKKFKTTGALAFQAKEFLEFCLHNQPSLSLRVHGDGLLRYLHESRYPDQYEA